LQVVNLRGLKYLLTCNYKSYFIIDIQLLSTAN
jgi:hypothetical protein